MCEPNWRDPLGLGPGDWWDGQSFPVFSSDSGQVSGYVRYTRVKGGPNAGMVRCEDTTKQERE